MEDDLLKKYVNSLGIDGQVYEALQRGDLQTMILSVLAEQDPDPLLATVMQFMLARDHTVSAGAAGRDEAKGQQASHPGIDDVSVLRAPENGQLDAVRATLRHVTLMLGACPACCGQEASCPECHGGGKPGSVPSAASAVDLRAWLEPLLGRMGMYITNPALPDSSPHQEAPERPQAQKVSGS